MLSLVAIAYSARNIVLPLIDLSSDQPIESAGASAGGLLLPSGTQSTADELDLARLRADQLTGIGYRRNPFLLAEDPRQPGYELSDRPVVEVVYGEKQTRPIQVSSLFILNAILDRDGQRVAMINRQIISQGGFVVPQSDQIEISELSPAQQVRLSLLLEREYKLTGIDQDRVELSSDQDHFAISFSY